MRKIPDRSKVTSSIAWSSLDSVASIASSLIATILVARAISPEEFGLAAIVIFFGSILEILITTLFAEAIVRRPNYYTSILNSAPLFQPLF